MSTLISLIRATLQYIWQNSGPNFFDTTSFKPHPLRCEHYYANIIIQASSIICCTQHIHIRTLYLCTIYYYTYIGCYFIIGNIRIYTFKTTFEWAIKKTLTIRTTTIGNKFHFFPRKPKIDFSIIKAKHINIDVLIVRLVTSSLFFYLKSVPTVKCRNLLKWDRYFNKTIIA